MQHCRSEVGCFSELGLPLTRNTGPQTVIIEIDLRLHPWPFLTDWNALELPENLLLPVKMESSATRSLERSGSMRTLSRGGTSSNHSNEISRIGRLARRQTYWEDLCISFPVLFVHAHVLAVSKKCHFLAAVSTYMDGFAFFIPLLHTRARFFIYLFHNATRYTQTILEYEARTRSF
jgi:hypothetical protein